MQLAGTPTGGLHLWLRLPHGIDDVELTARARRDNVLIEAGRPYFVTEPPAAYLRLTYAAGRPTDLTTAVHRLAHTMTPDPPPIHKRT